MSILEKLISILLEKLDIGKWTFSHPSFTQKSLLTGHHLPGHFTHRCLEIGISFKSLP